MLLRQPPPGVGHHWRMAVIGCRLRSGQRHVDVPRRRPAAAVRHLWLRPRPLLDRPVVRLPTPPRRVNSPTTGVSSCPTGSATPLGTSRGFRSSACRRRQAGRCSYLRELSLSIPSDPKRGFGGFCDGCRCFTEVAGATPAFLVDPPVPLPDEILRTDIEFGTGDELRPLIVVGTGVAEALHQDGSPASSSCRSRTEEYHRNRDCRESLGALVGQVALVRLRRLEAPSTASTGSTAARRA